MEVRDATAEDWPAIWRFMRDIAAAGETFSWDRDIAEEDARAYWLRGAPARAFVAVDDGGTVVGTAEMGRRLGGPAAHTASAGFMVDPAHAGRGAGRALGEHVIARARADGYRSIVFNAVAESNARAVGLWRSLGFEIVGTCPRASITRCTATSACTSCTAGCEGDQAGAASRASAERPRSAGMTCVAKSSMLLTVR
jgi:L-amino acid N-acyltransferase YncA